MTDSGHTKFSWINPVNLIIAILAFIIGLFTINSDKLRSFKKEFPDKKPSVIQLKEIVGDDAETKLIFVFALDISQSLTLDNYDYYWFNNTIKRVNARMPTEIDCFNNDDDSLFNFCKLRLASFLLDIENKDVNFAVWKFGDSAEKIYPSGGEMHVIGNSTDIINSIIQINRLKTNYALNTNIRDMFEKLKSWYLKKDVIPGNNKYPSVVFVMISDLIHDVKIKEEGRLLTKYQAQQLITRAQIREFRESCSQDKTLLKCVIKDLAEEEILVNVIVLKEAEKNAFIEEDCKSYIWDLLIDNKGLLNSKRRKGYIWDDTEEFFPKIPSKNKLFFFYKDTDEAYIKTSTLIKVNINDIYNIGLSDDPEDANARNKKLYYKKGSLDDLSKETINPVPKEDTGILISGAGMKPIKLNTYEGIQLTYKGGFPKKDKIFPYLEIRMQNSVKVYQVPIEFIKELDTSIVNIIKIIIYAVFFGAIFIVLKVLKNIIFKWLKGLIYRVKMVIG